MLSFFNLFIISLDFSCVTWSSAARVSTLSSKELTLPLSPLINNDASSRLLGRQYWWSCCAGVAAEFEEADDDADKAEEADDVTEVAEDVAEEAGNVTEEAEDMAEEADSGAGGADGMAEKADDVAEEINDEAEDISCLWYMTDMNCTVYMNLWKYHLYQLQL